MAASRPLNPRVRRGAIRASTLDATGGSKYVAFVDYTGYITIEPGKRSGKPCVRGLRITVSDVLDYFASGMSVAELLDDFPDLSRDDVRACLAFAADRERKLMTIPA